MNTGEHQVSKLTFTLNQLYAQYKNLLDEYDEVETARNNRIAALAKKNFAHVLDINFKAAKKPKKVRHCVAAVYFIEDKTSANSHHVSAVYFIEGKTSANSHYVSAVYLLF